MNPFKKMDFIIKKMSESVIDRFFEKYKVIVCVEIQTEKLHFNINLFDSYAKKWSLYDALLFSNKHVDSMDEVKKLIMVKKTDIDNCFQFEFDHKDMDGVKFIQNIVKGFEMTNNCQ